MVKIFSIFFIKRRFHFCAILPTLTNKKDFIKKFDEVFFVFFT